MKKTLAALAVLGAFAGTSLAADVTLYGVLDYGMRYTNKDVNGTKTDTLEMATGQHAGNRWGLKGTEELGNGLVVGFNLESGFNADDGALDNGGRLFGREAVAYVQGAFGEIGFGRTGGLDAGTGRYNLDGSKATPFGNGWSLDVTKDTKILAGKTARMDNSIVYKTPTFAGVTITAMASLKQDSVTKDTYKIYEADGVTVKETLPTTTLADAADEGSSDCNRYYALGATFKAGALNAGLIASQKDQARKTINANAANDDPFAVEGYVNYDFGMVKPMLAVQYFDGGIVKTGKKGYGVVLGATAPVLGGKAFLQTGYMDADQVVASGPEDQYKNIQFAVGYEYYLSKRTCVYTAAGYLQEKTDYADATKSDAKTKTTQFTVGLTHSF